MCFKNLPIEFDAAGQAAISAPASPTRTPTIDGAARGADRSSPPSEVEELLERNGHIKEMDFDPVTRVAGALAFHTVADFKARKVLEARSMATLFRGYEVIMIGRDPRDAIFITSRACGVCGGVHSMTSAMAIEMAIGVRAAAAGHPGPQPRARRWSSSTTIRCTCTCWPAPTTPRRWSDRPTRRSWARARSTEAPHADVHGFRTIGELMEDLNPLTRQALPRGAAHDARGARGVRADLRQVPAPADDRAGRHELDDHARRVMNEMFIAPGPVLRLRQEDRRRSGTTSPSSSTRPTRRTSRSAAGARNMIDPGIFDHPDAYDATYDNAGAWGDRRWATPGVIVDGELVTTDLHRINIGVEEFVEHSYYEEWAGNGQRQRFPTDPAGNPLSPYHPWNKVTKPRPQGQNWKEKYTWDTAPRWDRQAMEAGAYARLWNTAVAREAARRTPSSSRRALAQDAPAEGRAARDGDRVARSRGLECVRAQPRRARTASAFTALVALEQLAGGDGPAQARRHQDQHAVRDPQAR